MHGPAQSFSVNIYIYPVRTLHIASQQLVLERKKLKVSGVLENKMKVGGILDFTGGFGLKVRQVSARRVL